MRLSATDTLDIYEVTLDAAHTCTKVTDGNGMSKNGIPLHNLDPMYAPDGSLVFASTRGRPAVGPTLSLKYLLPQTDLWRLPRDGRRLRRARADDVAARLGAVAGDDAQRAGHVHRREGERGLLSALRSPHQLGPHRLPPAARAARRSRPASIRTRRTWRCTRRSNYAQATDIREARRSQLPARPVRRRRARAAAVPSPRSIARSARSKPIAPTCSS